MVYGFGLFTIIGGMLHLTPGIIFNMKQNKLVLLFALLSSLIDFLKLYKT